MARNGSGNAIYDCSAFDEKATVGSVRPSEGSKRRSFFVRRCKSYDTARATLSAANCCRVVLVIEWL